MRSNHTRDGVALLLQRPALLLRFPRAGFLPKENKHETSLKQKTRGKFGYNQNKVVRGALTCGAAVAYAAGGGVSTPLLRLL